MKSTLTPLSMILPVFAVSFSAACPVEGGVILNGGRELVEYFLKTSAREVTENGGEVAIRRSAEKIISRYGDSVVPLFQKLGPRAVSVVDSYGDDALSIVRKWGDDGVELLRRSGDEVMPLFKAYGDDAVRACIKHPGIGEKFISQFGRQGLKIAGKLQTKELIYVLRWAPSLKRQGRLKEFLNLLSRYGSKVFKFLEQHPKTLRTGLTAAGVVWLLNNPEKFKEFLIAAGEGAK